MSELLWRKITDFNNAFIVSFLKWRNIRTRIITRKIFIHKTDNQSTININWRLTFPSHLLTSKSKPNFHFSQTQTIKPHHQSKHPSPPPRQANSPNPPSQTPLHHHRLYQLHHLSSPAQKKKKNTMCHLETTRFSCGHQARRAWVKCLTAERNPHPLPNRPNLCHPEQRGPEVEKRKSGKCDRCKEADKAEDREKKKKTKGGIWRKVFSCWWGWWDGMGWDWIRGMCFSSCCFVLFCFFWGGDWIDWTWRDRGYATSGLNCYTFWKKKKKKKNH